jgi:hypothetical protein
MDSIIFAPWLIFLNLCWQVVSDHNLAMLVRQIALHCNLAANIYSNMQSKFVSKNIPRVSFPKECVTRL